MELGLELRGADLKSQTEADRERATNWRSQMPPPSEINNPMQTIAPHAAIGQSIYGPDRWRFLRTALVTLQHGRPATGFGYGWTTRKPAGLVNRPQCPLLG
jgi:hypothetical protein